MFAKEFTFRQKYAFDFIQGKLVYFFISNSVQEVITQVDFFAILSTNRSAVTILISKNKSHMSRFLEIQQPFAFTPKICQKNKETYSNLSQ